MKSACDPLLYIGTWGVKDSPESIETLTQKIEEMAQRHPLHLLAPATNAQIANLLEMAPAALASARKRGSAPPGYVRVGKVGRYYVSRHELLRWAADQVDAGCPKMRALAKRLDLSALARHYPFRHLGQRQLIDYCEAFDRVWFDAPMSGPAAAALFGKTPAALQQALQRDAELRVLRGNGPDGSWWPSPKTILTWFENQFHRQKEIA